MVQRLILFSVCRDLGGLIPSDGNVLLILRETVSPLADQVISKLKDELSKQDINSFTIMGLDLNEHSEQLSETGIKGTPIISLFRYVETSGSTIHFIEAVHGRVIIMVA
jgi:hypothetical protein